MKFKNVNGISKIIIARTAGMREQATTIDATKPSRKKAKCCKEAMPKSK